MTGTGNESDQRRRKLRIDQEPRHGKQPPSRALQNRMIGVCRREFQRGADVLGLEVRIVRQDFTLRHLSRQELENVLDADAHATDAGTPAALQWVDRDPAEVRHDAPNGTTCPLQTHHPRPHLKKTTARPAAKDTSTGTRVSPRWPRSATTAGS